MDRHKHPSEIETLLPWYAGGSLTAAEKQRVERWLRDCPEAVAQLEEWQHLREAVQQQPLDLPSPAVRARVLARVAVEPRVQLWSAFLRPLGGLATTLLILLLLWATVQPGLVLQWSYQDGPVTAFRVYRAASGGDFEIVGEVPAQAGTARYTFVDSLLWPGDVYTYRVVGIGVGGVASSSNVIVGNGRSALPGQLALLVASGVLAYGLLAWMRHSNATGLDLAGSRRYAH